MATKKTHTMTENSNALRFVNAYNQIEATLRNQCDLKASMSYTETIHRAARVNSIVKKYEDTLVDYGRLRNAIVHSSNEDYVIAEPYPEVVDEYEKLAKLISTPPLALNTLVVKEVRCTDANVALKDVLSYIYKTGYSNLPVYKEGMIIGVANAGKLAQTIGKKVYEKVDIAQFMNEPIENVIKEYVQDGFYTVVDHNITLNRVLDLFNENRKLLLIIITQNGSLLEAPLGIITNSDLIELNKVLDNFS